jgi:hypothetical protein
MKALTIHQPWASLIGLKRYETRHWHTFYRGAIAIHAGAKPPTEKDKDLWYRAHEIAGVEPPFSADDLPLMAIVSVSRLRAVKKMSYEGRINDFTISIDDQSDLEKMLGLWRLGRYAWDMGGYVCQIKPIEIPGRQGLWNVPSDLIESLEREYVEIAQG